MNTNELRKKYIEFFKKKNHTLFSSDSLVPDDASLLFTSAGMNQFKPYFLGEKQDVKRAVSCQKCLRTGDLEKVGKTAYHHTFFEMLGNFSFGDYFKKETIEWAWEFITKELSISEKDLWVSVYEEDQEAYNIWKDYIGVDKNKIVKLGQESNFWPASAPSLGPNGPCGPCSEIFFDRGETIGCKKKSCNPDCSCGRFIEVWNLVFTEFNRVDKDKLEPLPQKNIDTGMGLERMASVLQGVESNFEIDILKPSVDFVKSQLNVDAMDYKAKSLINAIVDHGRAAVFAISDGVYPSNEGRGYVIRKIIRKAVWASHLLGRKSPLLMGLNHYFSDYMGEAYPEIKKKEAVIGQVIRAEEEKFLSTLDSGKCQLEGIIDQCKKDKKEIVSGSDLFRLYDTHGFPLELSEDIIRQHKLKVDKNGFNELLQKQRELSRKKSGFDKNIFKKEKFSFKEVTEFVGYDSCEANSQILKLIENDTEVSVLKQGTEGYIILDKTPFYPQSGGQATDKGWIKTKNGEFFVEEVFKANEAIVHKGKVLKGEIAKPEALASIDKERRQGLMRAHTATHLLQSSLRKVLGKHVVQQGSAVNVNELRFDFTHFSRLEHQEQKSVEEKVREFISRKDRVEIEEISLEKAKEKGALAFFKDKYQNNVRVVTISDYSKELCGGTHIKNTEEIKGFTILSESSISSGIRRIKASVGNQALEDMKVKEAADKAIDRVKKAEKANIGQAIESQKKFIFSKAGDVIGLENIEGINFVSNFFKVDVSLGSEQSRVLLALSDQIKRKLKSVFIFTVVNTREKNIFTCSMTDDLLKKGLSCKEFVSKFNKELSLAGGGSDKTSQGVVVNKGDNFSEKVKNCFRQFIN